MSLPGTSQFLYGIQEQNFDPAALPAGMGWVMGYVEVGDNPEPHPGVDYSVWANQGYGTLCRIQYRWGNQTGTLPWTDKLDAYVERVRTCVQNSRGVHRWQVGNEPNVAVEWPNGHALHAEYVAECFNRVTEAILSEPGHGMDEVITPPVGPWNAVIGYGWVEYLYRLLVNCENPDAIALHVYSHGSDPSLVTSTAKMNPPYEHMHYNFRAYMDFLSVVPQEFRHLPVYITETNQYDPWLDRANGWIPEAYKEIDAWNRMPDTQKVHALILYRWAGDKWHIQGKNGVISDFRKAQEHLYTWPEEEPEPEQPSIVSIRQTLTFEYSDGTAETFSGTLDKED